ncbi:complex I subunit 5 family protein [Desulfohalovibrio reitneri]|uniref:complex I subunit 5 family protein n=1 Tax=Desulfohalovibrio reitneri TaxID=1307759 RepID=UPI0004A74AAE|nr:proton-conducting transporter membrane subunit [Desulfohalovibrio reitneri]
MQAAILTILLPLLGSILIVLGTWGRNRMGMTVALLSLVASAGMSVAVLVRVMEEGMLTYQLGGWPTPLGINLTIDGFSAVMLCLVAFASLLTLWSFRGDFLRKGQEKAPAMLGLYLLAVAGHMGIVATGDIFNLYVFIEVAALSGYALLSFGGARSARASLNYLLIGSVGASLYLLGVAYLYIATGSLNMLDVADIVAKNPTSGILFTGFVILVFGVWIKMALFPFHGWLPGAYGRTSLPSASLLAPLTTKVMAYVLVRFILTVFPENTAEAIPALSQLAVWGATAAIVAGAAFALAQTDLRRMLCYILVAEVGYMVGGSFVGNDTALTGTMLHVLADAAMTLTLFLALGNIVRRRGGQGPEQLDGLFSSMPVTMAAFVLGALSMIGVPPLCGFYSKWYLVSGAFEAGQFQFAAALLLSSLVNVVLFFRVFERAFFRKPPESGYDDVKWTRFAPLGLAAIALPLLGLLTGEIVDYLITPTLAFGA